MKTSLISIFVGVAGALIAGTAHAELRVCNHSGVTTWVAVADQTDDGSYESRGWTAVDPNGGCVAVVKSDLKKQYYYVYGRDDEGMEISGHNRFCAIAGRTFDLVNAEQTCAGPGRDWKNFLEVDTGNSGDFTFDIYDKK